MEVFTCKIKPHSLNSIQFISIIVLTMLDELGMGVRSTHCDSVEPKHVHFHSMSVSSYF